MKLSSFTPPQVRWAKAAAIAAAAVGLVGTGWTVQGWRMGKRLAEQAQRSTAEKLTRQTALTEQQRKDVSDALRAVLSTQEQLNTARAANRALAAKAAADAPKTPEYACRALPLPEPYLEDFRR